ncbi:MazG nucleotide pyrophosphohydrolase domain-containing protein [Nocardioides marmoraquaticus]
MSAAGPSVLEELVTMMRRLRAECGWKAAQTHRTLARHLLEESHELAEVLDELEPGRAAYDDEGVRAHLREELGDVLLQVLMHAAIAEQHGWFDVEDVAATLREKLLRRNTHVFGTDRETDPTRINELWEAAKRAEKPAAAPPTDADLPATLPALLRADKLLDRRARAGLPTAPEPRPGDAAAEVGAELLAVVARARGLGVDPEQALRDVLRGLAS